MGSAEETLKRIRAIAAGSGDRTERAKQLAEAVRGTGNYRWTGIYDVGSEMVSIVAYSSASAGAHAGDSEPGAPAYPAFPATKGLTGSAIREKATIVVGDVRTDPRYLTAFGNTLSEIIVPIVNPLTGAVIGTIDVESEPAHAFSPGDQHLLEECARAALPLWIA
jgi:putative methionine-R-sulfoxide reductase with GAF domain